MSWDRRFGPDDCLTVVTADHGEHLGDHGYDRGHGTLWQTNLWVPLMVRAPRMIAPGTVVKELTRQIDVLPTILDYCGVPMPHNVEGASLRGLIEGTEDGLRLVHQGQSEPVFHRSAVTIRNERYAFHFDKDGQLIHLFDCEADPGEAHDLLHQ